MPNFYAHFSHSFFTHLDRLMLAVLLAALDQTIVATALPTISSGFGASDEIGWVGISYMLTSTVSMPLYGRFVDIFGRKPVFLFGIVVFLAGSIVSGASQNMDMLIAFRALQGLGAGGIISLVMIIISDLVSLRDRGKYQGLIGTSFGIASVVGPLLGGALTDHASWRWCFYINVPIGAVTLVVVVLFLHLPTPQGSIREKLGMIDYIGSFFLIACTVCILLPLQWGGNQYAWNAPVVIALFCVGGVLLFVFSAVEVWQAKAPIIPGYLFRQRTPIALFVSQFFFGLCFFGGAIYYTPIYFQVVRGDSATSSGLELLPLMLGLVLCSITSGLLCSKTGHVREFIWIGLSLVLVGGGLLTTWSAESNRGMQIGYLLILGCGCGLCVQTLTIAGQSCVGPKDIAVITSLGGFFRTIGACFGIAIFGTVFNNTLSEHLSGLDLPFSIQVAEHSFALVKDLPEPLQSQVKDAYCAALDRMFLLILPFGAVALISSLFIQHFKLHRTLPGQAPEEKPAETTPVPVEDLA
ncbi:transmembrane efflux protein [Umbelopsis sp. PMI_123]|nr:transmembrane efflux protein [Umbelopsis sp. PMI_123]